MTLPADTFIVTNKTVLNQSDLGILLNLYQPLIGNESVSLYYTLWSYLDKMELFNSVIKWKNIVLNVVKKEIQGQNFVICVGLRLKKEKVE